MIKVVKPIATFIESINKPLGRVSDTFALWLLEIGRFDFNLSSLTFVLRGMG
jgi:hypothetical protein